MSALEAATLELAWAAGFYDGEGSAGAYTNGTSPAKANPHYRALRVRIDQIDREVLDRFRAAVGLGNVTGPHKYDKRWNRQLTWNYCVSASDAEAVLQALRPFLGTIKRQQGDDAIAAWKASKIPLTAEYRKARYARAAATRRARRGGRWIA